MNDEVGCEIAVPVTCQTVDRLEELLADTRSVRQSEITTELLDVLVGFFALKSLDKPRLP